MVKQVIIVRRDLNMRKGKMIAQGAHASMKVFLDLAEKGGRHTLTIPLNWAMSEWVNGIFTKVVVSVDSEEELLKLVEEAKAIDIPSALIQDAGRTEFHGVPTYTAAAIGPAEAEDIDKITGHLKLL